MPTKRWTVRAAVLTAAALLAWPGEFGRQEAAAADRTITALVRIAEGENRARRGDAVERLRRLGISDARRALEGLADSGDVHLAALALSALGRSEYAGARRKIESVYENPARSDVVRALALSAWGRLRSKEGATWPDVRAYVESHAGTNRALLDAAASLRRARFEREAK